MRTYAVTVRDDDLPRLEAVARRLWEQGCLGASLDTDTLTFDDDVYDVLEYLGSNEDGCARSRRMTIGRQLYEIRQVA